MPQEKERTRPDLYLVPAPATGADVVAPLPVSADEPRPHLAPPWEPGPRKATPGARSEIGRAIDRLNNLALAITEIHHAVRRRETLELRFMRNAIAGIIDAFAEDPNTLFWALAANRRMYHLKRRAAGSAVWALALGRQLGFDTAALTDLMLGATLLDIGKLNVPVVILAKGGALNESERKFVQRHVRDGVRALENSADVSPDVIEMLRSHHERIDGGGYPFGLRGDEISLYAQIAGIVDTFDALSLSRYYAAGISGYEALAELRRERGKKFAAHLVDAFVAAIGEFPTGTWLQFEDGRTGVVCAQSPRDPGSPEVVLIADANEQPFLAIHRLTLRPTGATRVLPPHDRPDHAGAMERSLQAAIYARPARD
jgi:HD-GYP domain-containing protein (c-di-GMP phosphodiesterase class II)